MRNKHPIQLAGITLFTRQSTTQDTCAPEKEEKVTRRKVSSSQ